MNNDWIDIFETKKESLNLNKETKDEVLIRFTPNSTSENFSLRISLSASLHDKLGFKKGDKVKFLLKKDYKSILIFPSSDKKTYTLQKGENSNYITLTFVCPAAINIENFKMFKTLSTDFKIFIYYLNNIQTKKVLVNLSPLIFDKSFGENVVC